MPSADAALLMAVVPRKLALPIIPRRVEMRTAYRVITCAVHSDRVVGTKRNASGNRKLLLGNSGEINAGVATVRREMSITPLVLLARAI